MWSKLCYSSHLLDVNCFQVVAKIVVVHFTQHIFAEIACEALWGSHTATSPRLSAEAVNSSAALMFVNGMQASVEALCCCCQEHGKQSLG